MPQTRVERIKNGSVRLPRDWQGAEVLIMPSEDSVLIKKISRPTLSELRPKLQKLGKLISAKEIRDAVRWARNKTSKTRS